MADGKGCKCAAYGECECACGADWTPQEVYDLRAEVARLKEELASLRQQQSEPVAWMVEENVTMREDFAALIGFSGAIVGTGRAIPHSWKPMIYAAPPAQSESERDAVSQVRNNYLTRTDITDSERALLIAACDDIASAMQEGKK